MSKRLLRRRFKGAVLPLVSRSPRIRWWLASLTTERAYYSVCSTRDENELDKLGELDAQRVVPLVGPESVVLDIGCGVGRVEKFLAPFCKTINAVDISDRMIDIARKRLAKSSNVRFTRCNATDIGVFENETFDLCFSFHCLQHMPKESVWLALGEIHRVLKKNGTAYLHFPSFTSETYFALFKDQNHWGDDSRVRAYTMPELEKMVSATGFKLSRSDVAGLNPFVKPIESDKDILLTLTK